MKYRTEMPKDSTVFNRFIFSVSMWSSLGRMEKKPKRAVMHNIIIKGGKPESPPIVAGMIVIKVSKMYMQIKTMFFVNDGSDCAKGTDCV